MRVGRGGCLWGCGSGRGAQGLSVGRGGCQWGPRVGLEDPKTALLAPKSRTERICQAPNPPFFVPKPRAAIASQTPAPHFLPQPPIFCPGPPFFALNSPPNTSASVALESCGDPSPPTDPKSPLFCPKATTETPSPPPSPTLGGLCVGLWGTAGFCPTDRPLPARGAAQVLLCSGYGVRGEETGAALLPLPASGLCPDPIPSPIPSPGVVPSPCIVPIPNLSASLIPNPVFLPPFPAHLLISAPFFPHSQSRSYSRSISQR